MDARDFFGYKSSDEEPGRPDGGQGERAGDEGEGAGEEPRVLLPEEAITLDDPATLARIDPEAMRDRVAEIPTQLRAARRIAAPVELATRHRAARTVLVLGMGGSAVGAELVASAVGERLRVPLIVHRDYGLPTWAGEETLVVAASHSGETVETLSGARLAQQRGLPLVVIATGGSLGRLATEARIPYLRYGAAGQPRAAVGFGVGLMHELLYSAGLIDGADSILDAADDVERSLAAIGPGIPTERNAAKQLAWAIFGRIPVIYGAGPMAAVARRWKTQFNENAKAWALAEAVPEANHNAIEGTLNPREEGDSFYVVQLRLKEETTEIAERYRVVEELLAERAANRSEVWGEGATRLGRVVSTVAHGDLVSVYLAILYQTDPTPVTLLAVLKERLARLTE